jgi:RNA polymerase sigma factor (sigma-70 family)
MKQSRMAAEQSDNTGGTRTRAAGLDMLHAAARRALDLGDVAQARRLIGEALETEPSVALADDWQQLRDMASWPDGWLVAAVRRDPPDTAALDTLAERHWKPLFARCQLLTLNHQKANDLAQEAWCRLLRARHALKPDGNFPAYLATIATNLWRDRHRANRRAGALAEDRLLALDAPLRADEGETVLLRDVVPDGNGLNVQDQALLALDIDRALERLTPQLRDVLISRFLMGESCAEIGHRYGRTEQTISGWVRAAVRETRLYFEEAGTAPASKDKL